VNELMNTFLLLSVPGLPLLLALPALHSRLRWPLYLALLPAVILWAVPADIALELPWLLFGSGVAIDGDSRWLLASLVLIWLVAGFLLQTARGKIEGRRLTTFLLLMMGGSLSAILVTEMAGFFACLVLLGYAYYGVLLTADDSEASRSAARLYLVLLVLSDVLLFETLLVAAIMSAPPWGEATGGETLHQAAVQTTPSSLFYLLITFVAFAARGAIWPLQSWLPRLSISPQSTLALLLGAVVVAIALLGMVRWLPLGEIASPRLALLIQGVGGVALLYAVVMGLKRPPLQTIFATLILFFSGLFIVAVGVGLADPAVWNGYSHWGNIFIVIIAIGLAIFALVTGRPVTPPRNAIVAGKPAVLRVGPLENRMGDIIRWASKGGFETLPRLRTACVVQLARLWQPHQWQRMLARGEACFRQWHYAIALSLLLAIVVVLIGISFQDYPETAAVQVRLNQEGVHQ